MNLENILGELFAEKDGKREAKPYSSESFYNFAKGLTDLGRVDVSKPEGLNDYLRLTGEDPAKYSLEEVDLRRRAWISGGHSDLGDYIHSNFDGLVGELDEVTRTELAKNSCPEKESDDASYEFARKIVSKSKKTLEEMKRDPEGFLKRNAGSPTMAFYMRAFSGEYFGLKQREAVAHSSLAVRHYGSADFLITSKSLIDQQYNEFKEKKEELQKEINKKIDEESVKIGRIISANENAHLTKDLRKRLSELSDEYPDAGMRDDLAENCAGLALKFLKEKYEKPDEQTND